MTSLVRKTAIKTGTIAVSESVRSLLRKIQEDLQCPSNLSSGQAPVSPAAARNALVDQFCFNVADPAPSIADQHAPEVQQEERFSTTLQMLDSLPKRIDNLSDTLLGVEV